MSTTKQQLHTLVEQVPADKEDLALKVLRQMLRAWPENDVQQRPDLTTRWNWCARRLRRVGERRIGLDVDQW